jgi:HK97 family phage portal protein
VTYAAMSMTSNAALSAHMANFFSNMARPSFILSTDMALTSQQMSQLREAWNKQSVEMNSGGVPILANGLKAQPLSLNSQDSQLVEAFRLTVEDIARALRIPLPLIGIQSTYNNTEQLISFWLATSLGYYVNHIEKAIDKFFDLPADEFTEFDTDTLLRTDFVGKVDGLTKAVQGGLMSPDEARSKLELGSKDGGDKLYLQQQMVALDTLGDLHNAELAAKLRPPPAPQPPQDPQPQPDTTSADTPPPEPTKEFDTVVAKALLVSMREEKRKQAA